MSVCVHCGISSSFFSTKSWLCTQCTSNIFPFNHIDDDNEFYWTMYDFFHLNRRIDIDKLLKLKLNPFCMNKYDVHSLFDSDLEIKN